VVFNEDSADVDFRVESNNSANMLFVDGGNDEVVIQKASSGATATAGSVLIVEDDDNAEISILGGSSSVLALNFGHSGDADDGKIDYNTTSGSEEMRFFVNAAERMSIDKDGNFLIGDLQEQTHGGRISQTVVSGDSGISIMSRSATDSHQPEITLMKTPATSGNYTATADGEALGSIKFRGVNTSAVSDIGAQIRAVQNGTESGTVPANLIFSTNETDRLTIAANGTASFSASVVAETDTDTSNTGSVTLNFAEHQNFVLTFTGNVTLANPTTETVGQSGFIACIQDGTGSRTLSLGTDYETAGGAGITLSTAASATDLIPYVVIAANRILLGAPQLAFS
jgi:prepilin-type processing-associated H-X9-DG protein